MRTVRTRAHRQVRSVAAEAPWLEPIQRRLRERIAILEETGATETAGACRWALAMVEAEARSWWLAVLDREEAARERGISTDTIDRRLKRGELTNVGPAGGRPRIRRAELWAPARDSERESVVERWARDGLA